MGLMKDPATHCQKILDATLVKQFDRIKSGPATERSIDAQDRAISCGREKTTWSALKGVAYRDQSALGGIHSKPQFPQKFLGRFQA